MRQQFQSIKMHESSLAIIASANAIIDSYRAQGFTLTLRQIYYQFIARDLLPESWIDREYNRKHNLDPETKNTPKNYKRLGELISNGRLAGLIDWNAIEDRTRSIHIPVAWDDPADIIRAAHRSFKVDRWKGQPNRVEVYIEKDALIGVIEGVCRDNDVSYTACRGYSSQSEMYDSARRIAGYIREGQEVTILHLGDHDPSGIDMTRDIQDRLDMFLRGLSVGVDRLALNWDQVQQYNPPPNPAKMSDSRFKSYEELYGDESWELDALEPAALSTLIEAHILALRDDQIWQDTLDEEEHHRSLLEQCSDRWEDVAAFLRDGENE